MLETWQEAQLEPNTLIEAEGLSANAKARAEALRLETFESEEEGGKFVITLFLLLFLEKKKKKKINLLLKIWCLICRCQ